jgi:hypothetical protein
MCDRVTRRKAVLMKALPLVAAVAGYQAVLKPRLRTWGASKAEQAMALPGDGLIPGEGETSTMATDIDAPPEAVWAWLAQMGTKRAGYYSWDWLDNGGHSSAREIHPEWQDIEAGDRLWCSADGSFYFDVAAAEAPRSLVLRNVMGLVPPRRLFSDGRWEFHLEPLEGGRTRLLVRSGGAGPNVFPMFDLVHWIMQVKQFAGLRSRASGERQQLEDPAPEGA